MGSRSQTDDSSFAGPFLSPSQHTLILSQFFHLSAYMRVSNDICEEYFHEALLKLVVKLLKASMMPGLSSSCNCQEGCMRLISSGV